MNRASALKDKLLSERAQFSVEEAQHYIEEVLASLTIDTRERFYRRFFLEFVPLVAITKAVSKGPVEIQFGGSGRDIDAALVFTESGRRQLVEMTAAIDGHQEALRMEHLAKFGCAPVTERIEASGREANRSITYTEASGGHASDYTQALLGRIKAALEEKRCKFSSRQQYQDAWLGIVIPDYPPTNYKKPRFDGVFKSFLRDTEYTPFARIFIVSTIGDYVCDSLA